MNILLLLLQTNCYEVPCVNGRQFSKITNLQTIYLMVKRLMHVSCVCGGGLYFKTQAAQILYIVANGWHRFSIYAGSCVALAL